ARGAGARHRLAGGGAGEDVTALQGALRVVAGEREREALELARASLAAFSERRVRLAGDDQSPGRGGGALVREPPPRAGADLPKLLVQARALTLQMRGRRARE